MASYEELLKDKTKHMSLELVQNDQTRDISTDESDFFPVMRNRMRCNIIDCDDK